MRNKPDISLVLLSDIASEYKAKLCEYKQHGEALYELEVDYSDQRTQVFFLTLTAKDSFVSAQEKKISVLPAFCPERHINRDGTFCIGWGGIEELRIVDESSARNWWEKLIQFLRAQRRAVKKRVWPGETWAHGGAAPFQYEAEQYALKLGQAFIEKLKANKLHVKRKINLSGNGSAFKFYIDGKLSYSVWEKYARVANTRQPCICYLPKGKRRKRMRSCEDHTIAAANLVISLWNFQLKEQEFWGSFKDKECCGTMNNCPLAS
jgi:hypothetical protein